MLETPGLLTDINFWSKCSRKDLKEPCTLDDLRDVFMKIRAMIDNRQEGWAQYVLPAENALPDGLVTASSAVDIAADAPPANDLFDDREELAQLMIETRAVLARQGIHLILWSFLIMFCSKCAIYHDLKNCRRQWLFEYHIKEIQCQTGLLCKP